MIRHPEATFEGVLPIKVKNEVILKDWVSAIIAPTDYRQVLECHIPEQLKARIHFIPSNCKDIWEWSEKVYEYVEKLNAITSDLS